MDYSASCISQVRGFVICIEGCPFVSSLSSHQATILLFRELKNAFESMTWSTQPVAYSLRTRQPKVGHLYPGFSANKCFLFIFVDLSLPSSLNWETIRTTTNLWLVIHHCDLESDAHPLSPEIEIKLPESLTDAN
jgi:hypothetical protein